MRNQRYRSVLSNLVRSAATAAAFAVLLVGYADAQTKTKCKKGSRSAKCMTAKPPVVKQTPVLMVSPTTKKVDTISVVKDIPASEWGDAGTQLSVLGSTTEIVFDCANGVINRPFGIDADGDFDLSGDYTPVLADTKNRLAGGQTVNVRYRGKVSGNEMTLSIISADGSQTYGQFTLSKDTIVRIRRCG